jgi:hypothetical protein
MMNLEKIPNPYFYRAHNYLRYSFLAALSASPNFIPIFSFSFTSLFQVVSLRRVERLPDLGALRVDRFFAISNMVEEINYDSFCWPVFWRSASLIDGWPSSCVFRRPPLRAQARGQEAQEAQGQEGQGQEAQGQQAQHSHDVHLQEQ